MAYSLDFIERTVAYKQEGHTLKQLQEAFGVPSETYYDWKKKLENGHFDVKIKRERKRKIDKEQLKRLLEEKPDAFLWELAEHFSCTPTAVFYALENLDITRKKTFYLLRKIRREKSGV